MRPIVIGHDAADRHVVLTPELRRSTHMHVIGGSGKGKSKFLEWLIRKDIRAGHGLCLIDWHGTLYRDVLNYLAELRVGLDNDFRSVVLLNPSQPDYITGFNPFMNQGADVATQVSRRIEATIRPWGITDTNLMPTFERVCRLLYTFAVERDETLPNAARLLEFEQTELREYAVRVISDPYIRQQWQQLSHIKSFRDWKEFVLSTENRLARFLGSKTIKRFMGMKTGNLNILEAMDEGKIVLVNLGTSGFLDRESARVFASLMLNEFFETAMLRADQAAAGDEPKAFSLYLDEFQEYITEDIAAMLDQVRKGGLHMVLAHQHLAQLAENPRLLHSVLTNARIRAVFGGLSYDDASLLGNEMFLPDLNTRQIKKAYYHTTHLYSEQTRLSHSHSTGHTSSRGSTHTAGRASGSSVGTGISSLKGSGKSASTGTSTPGVPGTFVGIDETEGWFSESDGTSEFNAESSTVFHSSSSGESFSEAESHSESRSESHGVTQVPVFVPIPTQELTTEAEWSREEKLSKICEMLKYQQERHCFIKLDVEPTQPMRIPFVKTYSQSRTDLLKYEQAVYEAQGAIKGTDADRLLAENEHRFLTAATKDTQSIGETSDESTALARVAKKRRLSAREQLFSTVNTNELLEDR